eukprot:scaffold78728_cov57-Phaeocystis_antarctica.AAC.2
MDGCQHLGSEFAQVLAAKIGQAWLQLDSPGVAGRHELVHSAVMGEAAFVQSQYTASCSTCTAFRASTRRAVLARQVCMCPQVRTLCGSTLLCMSPTLTRLHLPKLVPLRCHAAEAESTASVWRRRRQHRDRRSRPRVLLRSSS